MFLKNEIEWFAEGCPFASDILNNGLVSNPKKANAKTIISEAMRWNDEYEVMIFKPIFLWKNFYSWCIKKEEFFSEFDLIAIPNEQKQFILLQRLSTLVKAGEELMKTGYYEKYTEEQMKDYKRRSELYGRLCNKK